jgi:anti-sigma B factor antagonist
MIDWETYRRGKNDEILVMEVDGRLDVSSSEYLLDCIEGHIEDGTHRFILDCSPLEFISSAGLGTLVRANKQLQEHGGAVALAGVKGIIAETIHFARLDKVFHLFPTVEDAEKSFA